MSNKVPDDVLDSIPDFTSWDKAREWIDATKLLASKFKAHDFLNGRFFSLDWHEIEQSQEPLFGLYSSIHWRKFVLSAFAADLLSYAAPVHQVDFERLLFVMHAFPQGFRIWWVEYDKNTWLPVGYTGWYPMLESQFQLFQRPKMLKDRMVVPSLHAPKKGPYLYLFNFSVIPSLRKTSLSKALMDKFIKDINAQKATGLACITVSEDGARIAKRLGMHLQGHLILEGVPEGVFVRR